MDSHDWAAEAYAGGKVFAAFDLETTGLDPKLDRVAEIGAVKFDKRGIIARFSLLINPGVPMPAEAGKVNGISDAMLAGQPDIAEVMPDFLRFIRGVILVAHNAPFDCGFINENLARLYRSGGAEIPALPNRAADTLVFSRRMFPGRRSYSLQNLAADLGITSRESHRAEDDARLCMEIFIRCLEAGPT